ncbi:MAG: radical SAM protein, partial [Bacillota bacterium]
MKNILLLEPNYKNKYPPLGLMKISTYHKNQGDNVSFFKGQLSKKAENKRWDRIYITTLFTYEWDEIIRTIKYTKNLIEDKQEIFVGGIAATLMAKEIKSETGIKPIKRKLDENNRKAKERIGYDDNNLIDECTPDYSILDEVDYKYGSYSWDGQDAYYAFMTRGCGMNCEFCAVDELEPDYEPYIPIRNQIREIEDQTGEKKSKLLLMDNNVLVSSFFNEIVEEIKDLGFYKNNPEERTVDFNQGLDANLLTEEKAQKLGELAIKPARIAFDHIEDQEKYEEAIKKCAKYGIKHFSNYMLYNGEDFDGKGNNYEADTPEDLYKRLKITMNLQKEINKSRKENEEIKIYSFPMKYIPIGAKDRNFIGDNWNEKFLRAIQVMLLPSQGVGAVSDEFFRKAFGEDLEEYRLNLRMPESILMSRGKFLKKDNETENERKKRVLESK